MGLIFWRYPHPTNCRLADVLSSTNYLLNRKPQENNHVLLIFPQQFFDLSICHFPVHYSAQNTLELNWSLCCEELTLPMIDSNSWNCVENLGSTAQTWLSVDLRSMHGEADATLVERKSYFYFLSAICWTRLSPDWHSSTPACEGWGLFIFQHNKRKSKTVH